MNKTIRNIAAVQKGIENAIGTTLMGLDIKKASNAVTQKLFDTLRDAALCMGRSHAGLQAENSDKVDAMSKRELLALMAHHIAVEIQPLAKATKGTNYNSQQLAEVLGRAAEAITRELQNEKRNIYYALGGKKQ